MKKFFKPLLSAVVAAAVGCTMMVSASAASYTDTVGHPAEAAIERWTSAGVVSGNNGTFNPDSTITRAEMSRIMTSVLGLRPAAGTQFSDVSASAWYAPYVGACANVGIFSGNGNGQFMPDAPITWQEAVSVLSRALCLEEGSASSVPADMIVSDWAKPVVASMVQYGIPAGTNLTTGISRANVMVVLDRSVETYINASGTYDLSANAGSGVVLIAAGNVTLTGSLKNEVVVAQGASPAADDKTDVVLSGSTKYVVSINGNDIIVEIAKGASMEAGVITADSVESMFIVNGDAGKITVKGSDSAVEVSGDVDTIEVAEGAKNTDIDVNKNGDVSDVETQGKGTTVSGDGSVDTVTVGKNAEDTEVTTANTKIINKSDEDVETAKGVVEAGDTEKTNSKGQVSSSSASSSSSSSSSSYYTLKMTIVDNTADKNTATASAKLKRSRNLLAAISAIADDNRETLRETFPTASEMNALITEGMNAQGNDEDWATFIADKQVGGDQAAVKVLKNNDSTLSDLGVGTYTLTFTDTQSDRTDITYTVTIKISK